MPRRRNSEAHIHEVQYRPGEPGYIQPAEPVPDEDLQEPSGTPPRRRKTNREGAQEAPSLVEEA